MTKKDITLRVTDATGMRQNKIKKILQSILDAMSDALIRGEKIELRNFGVFKIKQRKPRPGRNPRTGELVPVPARKVVVFKPGLELKKKIR
ncbi:MAG: integration host factor subunit beta [Candidatus Omnitrophica bacterium]|nr:integration host factor subunit beta [Candidatus Omnitrophota bacterium]